MAILFQDLVGVVAKHNQTHGPVDSPPAVCGVLRGKPFTGRPSEGFGSESFHSVVDVGTSTDSRNLPVVVCVGINYGQLGSNSAYGGADRTGMRIFLEKVLLAVSSTVSGQDFHLVATNFFPLLSPETWATVAPTRVADVALFADAGFADAIGSVAKLLRSIGQPSVRAVVCHGSHNSAPMLGWLLRCELANDFRATEWIFSDNISSQSLKVSNAIRLA